MHIYILINVLIDNFHPSIYIYRESVNNIDIIIMSKPLTPRDHQLNRDREIIQLTKKLKTLKEKLAQLEVENNKLQDNLANLQKLNIDEAAKKELALQLIKTLKEPYDAIKKIMEDMKNEVGQLSRGKMNELRRMTKPPLLIKKTLELGK